MRDMGKVALRDRGAFDASVSYEILDIVEYQGYVYCCYTPDTPAGTLPTDSTHFHRWFGSASADNTYQTNDSVENDIDDADYIPFLDSSASAPKRSLWSNLKDKFWTYVQSQLAAVATSGSYDDLEDKPTVDSALSTSSTNAIQNAPVATSMNALNLSLTQMFNDYLKIKVNSAAVGALNVGFNDITITPAQADAGYHHIGMLTVFPQTGQNISLVGITQGSQIIVRLYNHSNAPTTAFAMSYAMLEAKDNIFT